MRLSYGDEGRIEKSYLNPCSVVVLVALISMDQVKCSDRARLHHRSSGDPFKFSATRSIQLSMQRHLLREDSQWMCVAH